MLPVGHRIDHRVARVVGHAHQVAMRGDPGHDAVDVAVEDAADIGDGFALAELDLLGEQGDGVAAEPADGDLEAHPGAIAGTLEDHRQLTAVQGPSDVVARLGASRDVEHRGNVGAVEIGEAEKIASGEPVVHHIQPSI